MLGLLVLQLGLGGFQRHLLVLQRRLQVLGLLNGVCLLLRDLVGVIDARNKVIKAVGVENDGEEVKAASFVVQGDGAAKVGAALGQLGGFGLDVCLGIADLLVGLVDLGLGLCQLDLGAVELLAYRAGLIVEVVQASVGRIELGLQIRSGVCIDRSGSHSSQRQCQQRGSSETTEFGF